MPLVTFNSLMRAAEDGGYAVGYFESWSLESLLAVADAAEAMRSPVILGFSGVYLTHPRRVVRDPLPVLAAMGLETCRTLSIPVCLLFNECAKFDRVLEALTLGFSLVMYSDDRETEVERERRITQLTDIAHDNGQAVEAEMFALPGVGGEPLPPDAPNPLSDPRLSAQFVERTKINALAVNIGQKHLHGRCEVDLDLDRLQALRAAVDVPLVLHGATSVRRTDIRAAVNIGVRKVNVGSALKQAYFEALKSACRAQTDSLNPYEAIGSGLSTDVLTAGRVAMQAIVEEWMKLLGSAGKATSMEVPT